MRSLRLIVLLVAGAYLPVFSMEPDSLIAGKLERLLAEARAKFAPDKRTELFNAEVDSVGKRRIIVETTNDRALAWFRQVIGREVPGVEVQGTVLPAKDLEPMVYGVANLSVCNHRVRPGNAPEMATQTLLGTPMRVLKKERGYYMVRTPDRYISWTDDAAVWVMDSLAFGRWTKAPKIVYTAEYGRAYSEADERSLPVSDLVAGNILELLAKEKKYYKVAFPDRRIAYVPVKEAVPYADWVSRPNPDASQILATAKEFIGVPYLWGGTSVKGMDCSGFTKTCYYLNGIILARDASQQVNTGEPVDITEGDTISLAKCLTNLKPGDLLFFAGGKARGNNHITHTAIYMGNGEFIQASGLVKISSLLPDAANYDGRQSPTLVSARRMLTAIGTEGVSRIGEHPFYRNTALK